MKLLLEGLKTGINAINTDLLLKKPLVIRVIKCGFVWFDSKLVKLINAIEIRLNGNCNELFIDSPAKINICN